MPLDEEKAANEMSWQRRYEERRAEVGRLRAELEAAHAETEKFRMLTAERGEMVADLRLKLTKAIVEARDESARSWKLAEDLGIANDYGKLRTTQAFEAEDALLAERTRNRALVDALQEAEVDAIVWKCLFYYFSDETQTEVFADVFDHINDYALQALRDEYEQYDLKMETDP